MSIVTAESQYHLTGEQLEFFDTHGYVLLKNWIPEALLTRLQRASEIWMANGANASPDDPRSVDYKFARREDKDVFWRVDYVHNKGEAASLELLGSPYVLGVAESMCGRNFVPTYESLVFKQEGDGAPVPWHQDAVHPRKHRIFNYDLYLDDSRSGAGALRVIPGTNVQAHDVCAIADQYGWDHPDAITVEVNAGDVLLHDVMVVHGSERTQGNALRRTLYYEFRAAEEIIDDGPWDETWIDRRMRLLPIALRRYQEAFPDSAQFEWHVDAQFKPEASNDDEIELKIAHEVHMNGSWCSAGDALKKLDV
ncbi:MAG: phytanoyl-CoA dioxygenase family protein [Aggregatilineales bacterium]